MAETGNSSRIPDSVSCAWRDARGAAFGRREPSERRASRLERRIRYPVIR